LCTEHPADAYTSVKYKGKKVHAYKHVGLVAVCNLHLTRSSTDYCVGVDVWGLYHAVLLSDNKV
jgi:hypothetical protein